MNQRLIDSLCACVLACVMSCQVVVWYGMESYERELVHARTCHGIQWWYHIVIVWNDTRHIMFIWFFGPLVLLSYCNIIDIVQCGWVTSRDLYASCHCVESMGETRYY